MALSTSGKVGSNVSKMDGARKKRKKSSSSSKLATARDNVELSPLAPQQTDPNDPETDEPAPKATPKVSNRRFNKVKVDRLKSEIANGHYQIDYLNVADKFIEHERYA